MSRYWEDVIRMAALANLGNQLILDRPVV